MSEAYPEMLVGAGTVLTIDQVNRAVKAGAKFIVSPGFDPEIVDYCLENNIPVLPGCITPSEVAQAVKRGLKVVKFFPAEQAGGIAMIKAMAAPYTMVKFMPTGGINTKNLADYLSCDKILCCGGSWMVKGDMIKAGEFDKITAMTKEAVARLRKSAANYFSKKNKSDSGISSYKERYGLEKMNLNLRPASECKFDAVSLGEVMLRLDPGEAESVLQDPSAHGKAAESTMLSVV